MNVRKLVGRGLIGVGLLLMMIGTASVPSTSWAGALPAVDCKGICNECGTPSDQGGGAWKCFKDDRGVAVAGSCINNTKSCDLCTGKCDAPLVNNVRTCVCERE